MTRFQLLSIPLALFAVAGTAGAQRWGGSPASTSARPAGQVTQASGGSWNGTASQWGGSPIQQPVQRQAQGGYIVQTGAYIPVVVAAPAPIPVTYVVDTVYAQAAPVEMKVVSSGPAKTQPSTMDVYRQQARFQKP
jgi:hypothetical protein